MSPDIRVDPWGVFPCALHWGHPGSSISYARGTESPTHGHVSCVHREGADLARRGRRGSALLGLAPWRAQLRPESSGGKGAPLTTWGRSRGLLATPELVGSPGRWEGYGDTANPVPAV